MMSELKEERIRKLAKNGRIAFKKHTALRMRQRGISSDEVKEALQNCKIIESYPNDHPFPSGLVVGYTSNKRAIHAVLIIGEENKEDGMLWIITVYEPNVFEWEEGFEKRRKR
jgi:hypothetical protein